MSELVLKNTSATLEMVFSAGDADAAVTVNITKSDGTALVTGGATTRVAAGDYKYTLAPQAELDLLEVTWLGVWGGVAQSEKSYAEIVGGHLFTLSELRAFGDKAVANTTAYPDTALRAARQRAVDLFWNVTRMSFFPRFKRETLDGSGLYDLTLCERRPTRVIYCSINGSAQSSPQLATIKLYQNGRAYRPSGWPLDRQNIVIAYEYGWSNPPADIARAAMTLARYELVSSDVSDRMVSFANDLGTFRLSVPGDKYPTGIPVVDSTLMRYCEEREIGP